MKLVGAVLAISCVGLLSAFFYFLDFAQNPTLNVTQLDIIVIGIPALVTVLGLPLVLYFVVEFSKDSESSSESDGKAQRVGLLTIGTSAVILVVISAVLTLLLFSPGLLTVPSYHPYEEYNGGEIDCHVSNPTYQSNIQEEEVVDFSSLNELDKKILRMTINNSYLVSVREDLSKTEEYDLLVTKDRGYDKIVIYEGEVGGSTYFPPPDGILSEPTMNITGSEYFSGGFEQKPHVRYRNETYRCSLDNFYVGDA